MMTGKFSSFIGWILYNICYVVVQITVRSQKKKKKKVSYSVENGQEKIDPTVNF